jgi:hypothetical protein
MDISGVLDQMRKELEHLDAAIASLERLQQRQPQRGRPAKPRSESGRSAPRSRSARSRQQSPGGSQGE